jgi:2-amino-4-hydroxy-6-hydroxymethyldihydropteridine diphosphokinase
VTTRAYVALGANLGDRAGALESAIAALRAMPRVRVVAVSRVWETAPVGPPQPAYLNAAAALDTELDALELLLFGGLVIEAPELVVPHPRMHERPFVLEPLAEIASDVVHPVLRETIATLAARVRDPSAARVVK